MTLTRIHHDLKIYVMVLSDCVSLSDEKNLYFLVSFKKVVYLLNTSEFKIRNMDFCVSEKGGFGICECICGGSYSGSYAINYWTVRFCYLFVCHPSASQREISAIIVRKLACEQKCIQIQISMRTKIYSNTINENVSHESQ